MSPVSITLQRNRRRLAIRAIFRQHSGLMPDSRRRPTGSGLVRFVSFLDIMGFGCFVARACLACLLTLAVTRTALAESSASGWLTVDREPGTSSCPSALELRHATERLYADAARLERATLHVRFQQRGALFIADLNRLGESGETRRLEDTRGDCSTLAQTVVTALCLMLETEIALPPPKVAAPPPRPPKPRAPPATTQSEPLAPTRTYRLELGLRAGAALGAVGAKPSPFGALEIGLGSDFVRAGFGGLWAVPQRTTFGPGQVELELLAASSRICLRVLKLDSLTVWTCSGVLGGTLRARAEGYTSTTEQTRPWLAFPIDSYFRLPLTDANSRRANAPGLGLRAGAGLVIPTRHETFSVSGLGVAVAQARVAGLLWLGLDGGLSF